MPFILKTLPSVKLSLASVKLSLASVKLSLASVKLSLASVKLSLASVKLSLASPKSRIASVVIFVIALYFTTLYSTQAQGIFDTPEAPPSASPAAPPPDPAMQAARIGFENLPEQERVAIQRDLIWSGGFTSATSGGFGPRTYKAIIAFQKSLNAPATGLLTPNQRKALTLAAEKEQRAAQFSSQRDARAGVVIGAPLALFTKISPAPDGGTRWQTADEKATLESRIGRPNETVQSLFERLAAAPNRHISYKLIKPNFFVIAGETATGKFYTRYENGAEGLRGYGFSYDKALSGPLYDKLVIAIADSFHSSLTEESHTGASASAAANHAGQPSINAPASQQGASANGSSLDNHKEPPVKELRLSEGATGKPAIAVANISNPAAILRPVAQERIVVSVSTNGGLWAARAALDACPAASLDGNPLQTTNAATPQGFSSITASTQASIRIRSALLSEGESVIVLGFLSADPKSLFTAPGEILKTADGIRVLAGVPKSAISSAVVDRRGQFVGLIVLDSKQNATGSIRTGAFPLTLANPSASGAPEAAEAEKTAGALARELSPALIPLRCGA